jgi:hypothetical protein
MARSLLIRGMLVGLAAGVVAFVVARIFGESAVAQAIAVEGAHAAHHGEAAEPELISRGVQSTIGLLTATVVYGIAFGGIFALVFGFAQGRLTRLGARPLSALLAAAGFVVIYAIPFLKFAPNPPAVGNPETIGRRTALYFIMIVISVLLAALAVMAQRRLAPVIGSWDAAIAAVVGYLVVVGLVAWTMPVTNEVGADFPATTLYHFRIASFGIQMSVWATVGLLFGALTERSLRRPDPAVPPAAVPV